MSEYYCEITASPEVVAILEQWRQDELQCRKRRSDEMRQWVSSLIAQSEQGQINTPKNVSPDRIVQLADYRAKFEASLDRDLLGAEDLPAPLATFMLHLHYKHVHSNGRFFYRYLRLQLGFDLLTFSFVRHPQWMDDLGSLSAQRDRNLRWIYANHMASCYASEIQVLSNLLDAVYEERITPQQACSDWAQAHCAICKQAAVRFDENIHRALYGEEAALEILCSYAYHHILQQARPDLKRSMRREYGSLSKGLLTELPAEVAIFQGVPIALLPGKIAYSIPRQHETVSEWYQREAARHDDPPPRQVDFSTIDVPDPINFVDALLKQAETEGDIKALMLRANLRGEEKTIFRLAICQGKTEGEIARRLGCSIGTVRSWRARVLRKLRSVAGISI